MKHLSEYFWLTVLGFLLLRWLCSLLCGVPAEISREEAPPVAIAVPVAAASASGSEPAFSSSFRAMPMSLSPVQARILLQVVKYRYLTNSQIGLLEESHPRVIRRATRALAIASEKFLRVKKNAICARLGRKEYVYSPTRNGLTVAAELLQCPEQDLSGQLVTSDFDQDFFHRKATITFHILLDLMLRKENAPESTIERYENYFDKIGANHRSGTGAALHAKTRCEFRNGESFIPDSVMVLRLTQSVRALFALEVVFGNKLTRTLNQLKRHQRAIAEGVLREKYGLPPSQEYVCLFLFDDAALMERVMEAFSSVRELRARAFREHFLFAALSEVPRDCLRCWRKVGAPTSRVHFVTGKVCSAVS